jgi:flavin reductase (DIM6/NTAB) family NADH-FMN oxidoreductase RutF
MQSFDFSTLSARDKYKILIGSVVPRPIALVTTVDGEGRINAPFSFFQCASADPPILALGVELRRPESKDTTRNIQLNQEFTVNIVSDALVEAMNVCAVPFAPGFDELHRRRPHRHSRHHGQMPTNRRSRWRWNVVDDGAVHRPVAGNHLRRSADGPCTR